MTDAYAKVLAHVKAAEALALAGGVISWDQEVTMPPKGAEARAETAGALQAAIHAKWTDPRIGEWLAAAEAPDLTPVEAANLRLIGRAHTRACRVPADLAEALARQTSRAHRVWATAREANDFNMFALALGEVVRLTRQRAEALAEDGQTLYDALIEDYEPGTTEAEIAAIFDALRDGLVPLRAEIGERWSAGPDLGGTFPADAQLALARRVAADLGYDFEAGRLDLAVHPFTSGGPGDVRITTRIAAATPVDCLYSTIHEAGHALYAQGLDPALTWQPAGDDASMGVHESQSRFYENQIGRSLPFAEYLFPLLVEAFGDVGVADAAGYYRATNRVEPGLIRTEADEVHYNLHIMMRFDLERALLSGDLAVPDLPGAWNERFRADFGVAVPSDTMGCLQDVHWSEGLIGYFPTYTLGNVYAACLDGAMRADMPERDDLVRRGDFAPILAWLGERVHRRGSVLAPRDLIADATGSPPDAGALLAYLRAKFLG